MAKETCSPSSPEHQQPFFQTEHVYPEDISPAEQTRLFLEAQERLQTLAQSFAAKDEVTKSVEQNHPIRVHVVGDLHFGHISADGREIIEIRDRILKDPYAGVIFVGDEIEGFTTKYAATSTSGTHANAQEQIEMIRELLLRPLAEQGRILAIVADYFGHPGWINESSTIDPWRLLAQVPNAYGINTLTNGGNIYIEFPNGYTEYIRAFHYAEGKSKFDPIHGLRENATRETIEERPNGELQGHFHRAAIAKEHYAGPGGEIPVYYISSGTAKGSSPDKPRDGFGRRIGRTDPADRLGQGVIIDPRDEDINRGYPFISFEHGEIAGEAIDLLNDVESQRLTSELLEQIRAKDHPSIKLVAKESRMAAGNSPYNEQPIDGKKDKDAEEFDNYPVKPVLVYDSLGINIETQLPIVLNPIGNVRVGSTVEGYNDLKKYLKENVAHNPHALVVLLRNTIDRKTLVGSEGHVDIERLVKLIQPIRNQVIALMLDGNLRSAKLPYLPGTYISQATDTPLIHHLSVIKIAVGPDASMTKKPVYTGAFADRLERSGSYFKPTFGLRRLYDQMATKPGYMTGGHLPSAGTMMFYHQGNSETKYPALIAPGWWAKYVDTIGSGNVKEGAIPGQGIIFMPGTSNQDYMVFPTANADETKYMHEALLLLIGIERVLGMSIQDVLSRKK